MTAPSSPARIAWSSAALSDAMFTGSSSFGRMSVAASSTPMFVPRGLKAWARLRRRVADSSGPIEMTKGFAEVSRMEHPAAMANRAPRKAS